MNSSPDAFWKYATVVSMSALLLLAFRSPAAPTLSADVVRARQFILLDVAGKPVGEWGPDQDDPQAISLRIYDSKGKFGDAAIRLAAARDGAEVFITGEPGSGGILMSTEKGKASLSVMGVCNDPSHHLPMRIALATLRADSHTGSLSVAPLNSIEVDGQHADSFPSRMFRPDDEPKPGK